MECSYLYLLVCVALVAGTPVARWATYGVVDRTPISKSTCAPFQYSVCNNNISKSGQGYSSALFPNPLAPQYLSSPSVAQSAAETTFSLAMATNCSPYITQFLCFAYFPLCTSTSPTVPPVLPCRSMCERVQCECEAALMASGAALHWPDWLNCDNLENVLVSYGALDICVDVEANDTCTAAPPTVSGGIVVNSSSPDNHTNDVTSFPDDQTCGSACDIECKIRANVTGATFGIANANYSFAAKVNVTNKYEKIINDCNFTLYDVTVLQSFNMCAVPGVPAMALPFPNATLTTNTNQCADLCVNMVPEQVYWVAGMFGSVKGVPTWTIPRFKGVAALWVAKYDEKGSGWLLDAMNQRGCSN